MLISRNNHKAAVHAHLHFIIWAATDKVQEQYSGVTYVDVMAPDIKSALARAKSICPGRAHYWVNNIVEHHDHEHEHVSG